MLLSIAWKNIWRKPSRSIVLITAIAIGLAGGVFSIAVADGMLKQRNSEIISQELSHIQIHTPQFYDNLKVKDSIENVEEIISQLNQNENIENVTSRLKFLGMANSARSTQGVMINGINPEEEKNVTSVYKCLIDSTSSYLSSESTNEIIISTKMAQNLMLVYYEYTDICTQKLIEHKFDDEILTKLESILDISMRSKNAFKDSLRNCLTSEEYEKYADILTNQATQYRLNKKIILRFNDINGELVDEAFKVVGIYKTNNAMFDNMNVFVNKKYIANLLDVPANTTTEIAIITTDLEQVPLITENIIENHKELLVESYIDLDPLSVYQSEYMGLMYNVIIAFILFALSFGIINTVLMSVLERTKELGMIMAIGMKKVKVFTMIMYESVLISLTGGIVGMILGAFFSMYFGKVGIDISSYSEAMESFGIDSVMYPSLSMDVFIGVTFLVILTGILSAIYPAKRALKLNPSEALRSDA